MNAVKQDKPQPLTSSSQNSVPSEVDSDRKDIYLIDGSGFIFRAFHALPPLTRSVGTLVGAVIGAFSSTAETHYLSLCLDHAAKTQVNTLMYQQIEKAVKQKTDLPMAAATVEQLAEFVEFAKANIGAPEEWVTGYYANLISRKELFGYWKNNKLLAAGECRLFDEHQTEYADLGMIVAESERGQGIATQVLTYLIALANGKGLTAMCSTEKTNIASQKAITRAGLTSSHRIVQFDF